MKIANCRERLALTAQPCDAPRDEGLGDGDGYYYGGGQLVYGVLSRDCESGALGPAKERLVMLMLLASKNIGITLELPSLDRIEGLQGLSGKARRILSRAMPVEAMFEAPAARDRRTLSHSTAARV